MLFSSAPPARGMAPQECPLAGRHWLGDSSGPSRHQYYVSCCHQCLLRTATVLVRESRQTTLLTNCQGRRWRQRPWSRTQTRSLYIPPYAVCPSKLLSVCHEDNRCSPESLYKIHQPFQERPSYACFEMSLFFKRLIFLLFPL